MNIVNMNMKAVWNGKVVAESDKTIIVEGNYYFPPDSIKKQYFSTSDSHTTCPWKGEASYFNVEVDGEKTEDAAWYYHHPKTEAQQIKDYIAFWRGVKVKE